MSIDSRRQFQTQKDCDGANLLGPEKALNQQRGWLKLLSTTVASARSNTDLKVGEGGLPAGVTNFLLHVEVCYSLR